MVTYKNTSNNDNKYHYQIDAFAASVNSEQ